LAVCKTKVAKKISWQLAKREKLKKQKYPPTNEPVN